MRDVQPGSRFVALPVILETIKHDAECSHTENKEMGANATRAHGTQTSRRRAQEDKICFGATPLGIELNIEN